MNKIDKYILSLPSLDNKKVVITGANSGLGYEIAKFCLSKNASVVLACRNPNRAQLAKENLIKDFPNAKIDILLYSQDKISSCYQFVDNLFLHHNDFYALVLNAGILNAKKGELNEDGLPLVSGTNSFGLLAIMDALNERLSRLENERRIIIQGSLAAFLSKYKNVQKSLQNPNKGHFYQYNNSKNAAVNIFNFYATNNKNVNVKFLLAEPGISSTNIVRNYPKWFRGIAKGAMRVLFQSAKAGALPTDYLLTSNVNNGDYYKPKHLKGVKGLPKKGKLKKKYLNSSLDEMREAIDTLNKKR